MLSKLALHRCGGIVGRMSQIQGGWYRGRYTHSLDGAKEEFLNEGSVNVFNDLIIPEPPMIDPMAIVHTLTEPSFASLGLNNYTPPGLVQCILENVHIYLNLPWWACIGITAVLLRSCMLPVMLNQRRVIASYQNSMTNMTKIVLDAIKAKESGNSILMMVKIKEFSNFIENQKLSMMNMFKPIFIQAPLFISVFMALRGMAAAPVASLQTGGLSWFTDLAVYDPYYILPLITAASLALIIETGAEAPGPQGQTLKWVFRCIPAATFVLICHFPSTLLLYWTCSNIYSLVFVSLLKIPNVQKALKIPDIKPSDVNNPNNYGFKEVMELLRSLQEVEMRHKAEEMRWKKESQKEVLSEGIAAAEIRKKIKNEIKIKELHDIENNKIREKM